MAQLYLEELGRFIVESNQHTWAGDGNEISGYLPEFKTLVYERGPWRLVDQYRGFFRAPGFTVVYYKELPCWTQSYGGVGQAVAYDSRAEETFAFLREMLLRNKDWARPYRGPRRGRKGDLMYDFHVHPVNEMEATWEEEITQMPSMDRVFHQIGFAGLVVDRDAGGKRIYPWQF